MKIINLCLSSVFLMLALKVSAECDGRWDPGYSYRVNFNIKYEMLGPQAALREVAMKCVTRHVSGGQVDGVLAQCERALGRNLGVDEYNVEFLP